MLVFPDVGLEITLGSKSSRVAASLLPFFDLISFDFLPGYIVTFFVKTRDSGAQSGLVSFGFFSGLALGRLIFVPLNRRLGEKIVTLMYSMAALGLECVVWLVPSLIGNAVVSSTSSSPSFPTSHAY